MISLLRQTIYPYVGSIVIVNNLKNWSDVHVITDIDDNSKKLKYKRIGTFKDSKTCYVENVAPYADEIEYDFLDLFQINT